jgi:hypothetical protein
MTRVTIISDSDDTYEMEGDNIHVSTAGYRNTVAVPNQSLYPNDLVGMPLTTAQGWEIVVTDDGETYSGTITGAEALQFHFRPFG